MQKRLFPFILYGAVLFTTLTCTGQKQLENAGKLLLQETFTHPLDTTLWKVELQPSPGSTVLASDSGLQLQTGAGATVWLNQLLKGNVIITYDRKVIMQGGKFDRLSDLNQFWMATDPHSSNLFTRNGKLEEYDSLQLYYVGMDGNSNSTTRFRRYAGGNRQLLGEFTDTLHLLQPNVLYHVKTIVQNGTVSFWVNDKLYFTFTDPAPFAQGYFGFRSTKSHQVISNLKIYQTN